MQTVKRYAARRRGFGRCRKDASAFLPQKNPRLLVQKDLSVGQTPEAGCRSRIQIDDPVLFLQTGAVSMAEKNDPGVPLFRLGLQAAESAFDAVLMSVAKKEPDASYFGFRDLVWHEVAVSRNGEYPQRRESRPDVLKIAYEIAQMDHNVGNGGGKDPKHAGRAAMRVGKNEKTHGGRLLSVTVPTHCNTTPVRMQDAGKRLQTGYNLSLTKRASFCIIYPDTDL